MTNDPGATHSPEHWLADARACLARGDDDGGERAYLEALKIDGANFAALNDLGVLAHRRGRRTAARLAHQRALRFHPQSPIAHVNLANILMEEADAAASAHYLAALAIDPGFAAAHKGLARFYEREGDERAEAHWRLAGGGDAVSLRAHRGVGPAIPLLLIVSAKLGNMPIEPWLDDRLFEAVLVEIESLPPDAKLPPHVAINLIADADLCANALVQAQRRIAAPMLNPPARVAATGRVENARRLGALPDVVAPAMREMNRQELASAAELAFPLLLRSPGFHAGRYFARVERREDLAATLSELPGKRLLAMSCLDARGSDGLSRKYRVMIINGRLYPLHLAISRDWKVHYFSAEMGEKPQHREEERRFLEDPETALGARAMRALRAIQEKMALDYFGVDFALSSEGALLLFEANAAMAMLDPPPEPHWDYRRPALAAARQAARDMVMRWALG